MINTAAFETSCMRLYVEQLTMGVVRTHAIYEENI